MKIRYLAMFVVVMLFASYIGYREFYSPLREEDGPIDYESKGIPVLMQDIVPKTTFEEVLSTYNKDASIDLPTYLPCGFEPVAAYTQNTEEYVGTSLFLYSKDGIDEVSCVELLIEVRPMANLPFDPKVTSGVFTTIGEYDVYYNEKASIGYEEYVEKYGETAILISLQKNNLNYMIRAEPSITLSEVLKIVESMSQ